MTDVFLGRCFRCKLARRFQAPVVRERGVFVSSRMLGGSRTLFDRERDVSAAAPFVPRSAFGRGAPPRWPSAGVVEYLDGSGGGVGEYYAGHPGLRPMGLGAEIDTSTIRLTQTEYHDRRGLLWLVCPAGHNVEFKRIVGRKNDEPCSAKCTSATGNICECSCGGENHGCQHG